MTCAASRAPARCRESRAVRDQLGRPGHGLARVEHQQRIELIFSSDTTELIAYQWFSGEDQTYAPVGTLVSWSAYIDRELVDALPPGTPPIPGPACLPPGGGPGTVIERGFLLGTGYFTELAPHLEDWHPNGVITDAQYHALKANT